LREEHDIFISYETIYLHIWSDKRRAGQLLQHLRRKAKLYQSGRKAKQAGRGFIRNRVSIDQRPQVVEDKNRIGDWEIDLVIGKDSSKDLQNKHHTLNIESVLHDMRIICRYRL
jgi:IS30 family transposase